MQNIISELFNYATRCQWTTECLDHCVICDRTFSFATKQHVTCLEMFLRRQKT